MKALVAQLQMRCAGALAVLRRRMMPPAYAALEIGTASWMSYALAAFCALELPRALEHGPKPAAQLEREGFGNAHMLERLLRALCAYGVVARSSDGRYRLARTGRALAGNASLAPMIIYANAPWHAAAYHRLAVVIRTGGDGFTAAHGRSLFAYLSQDTDASAAFDAAMQAMSALSAQAFVEAYDFGRVTSVVDVGGGRGALMQAVRAAYANVRATVFDLPHVVSPASAPEVTFVAGDILHDVPPRAQAYVMSHVLHDWPDEACERMLRNVRAAMTPDARLLIYEMVVPAGANRWSPDTVSDIEMLAMLGGKERTRAEFETLLTRSGLRLNRLLPAAAPEAVIECFPAESPNR